MTYLEIKKRFWLLFLICIFIAFYISCQSFVGTPPQGAFFSTGSAGSAANGEIEQAPIPEDLKDYERVAIEIYRKVNRSVVNITSVSIAYSWFFQPYPIEGTGSGSIVDDDGIVLTNYHVVKDSEKLTITLYDGSTYRATIIGSDPENDIALLKFYPEEADLTTIELGSSANLQIGQQVIALGNPFGLERTLTTGVISGLKRPIQSHDGYLMRNLIQTDAAINPGNSGGPLIDTRGKVIGINTMILTAGGGSIGIGFAVPIDTVRRVIPNLMEHGAVERGWIDITPIPIYPALANRVKLPVDKGILISSVKSGGNAEKAGLIGGKKSNFVAFGGITIYIGGDIIIAVNGISVATLSDYFAVLEETKPGDVVQIELVRGDGKFVIPVTLSKRPEKFGY